MLSTTVMRWVFSVAWHPDGIRLASGGSGDDGTVIIWDVTSGRALATLQGHDGPVYSVAWHPDGTQLASGADDGKVIIWDVASGQPLTTLRGHLGPVTSVAWHPDGSRLASGSGNEAYDLVGRTSLDTSDLLHPGSADEKIIIWDAASGQPLTTLRGHTGQVSSVAWSPDGRWLASGGQDKKVLVLAERFTWPACQWLSYKLNALDWDHKQYLPFYLWPFVEVCPD